MQSYAYTHTYSVYYSKNYLLEYSYLQVIPAEKAVEGTSSAHFSYKTEQNRTEQKTKLTMTFPFYSQVFV